MQMCTGACALIKITMHVLEVGGVELKRAGVGPF